MSDELDADSQRRLLMDLQALRALLLEGDELLTGDGGTLPPHPDAAACATAATAGPAATANGVLAQGELDVAEPPLLHEVVDHDDAAIDAAPDEVLEDEALENEESDWAQFVDQVFAQTAGVVPDGAPIVGLGSAHARSTAKAAADEDALLAELMRQLDERLGALRATLVLEMREMLARRRRPR